jgi:signal transduction histidine kinase
LIFRLNVILGIMRLIFLSLLAFMLPAATAWGADLCVRGGAAVSCGGSLPNLAPAAKDFVLSVQPLQPLITDTCAAFAVPGDNHVLKLDLPLESELAEFDSEKLRQALSNVVSNAFKYSPQGGEVSVTLQYRETASGPPDRHRRARPGHRNDARTTHPRLRTLLPR